MTSAARRSRSAGLGRRPASGSPRSRSATSSPRSCWPCCRWAAEAEARNILAVPTVYLGGQELDQGRMTLEQILARLDTQAPGRAARALDAKDPFDVLVVGASPAGISAAIYAARKGIRTGVIADRIGGQVLDTMAIEKPGLGPQHRRAAAGRPGAARPVLRH